jgi:pimeloyl-ACP methyl ester carboxylesterase
MAKTPHLPPPDPERRCAPLLAALVVSIAAPLLTGCAALRPARAPIPTLTLREVPSAECLVVLLPGRHSGPDHFRRGGFAEAAAARELAADLVAVDAHLGYYRERTIIERLHADVLAPARGRYDEVWVVGTSLGGLGGLLLLRDHPTEVDGVLALAPFLGEPEVLAAIRAAGGPRAWQPPEPLPRDASGAELWSFLRALEPAQAAKLHLGWGLRDTTTPGADLLAPLLPEGHTYTTDGGHDMAAWRDLWEQFLDRRRPCGLAAPPAGS